MPKILNNAAEKRQFIKFAGNNLQPILIAIKLLC